MSIPYTTFTWHGVTCIPIGAGITITDWLDELRQQERPIGGTGRVQVPSFGYISRWTGQIRVKTSTDYGTLRTAFLARPRTLATWSDGTRSIPKVVLTRFELLPLSDSNEGYTGAVQFVATEGL